MGKGRKQQGQSLVELAVVLPCFCLGIFMGVQLICYCHNMIELQRMAQVTVERQSPEGNHGLKDYWRFHSLWGRFTARIHPPQTQLAHPWRPSHGITTVQQAGYFRQIKVSSTLLPGAGFSRVFPAVTQFASAETYFEPPPPPED